MSKKGNRMKERESERRWVGCLEKRETSVIQGSVRRSHRTERTTDEPPDQDEIIQEQMMMMVLGDHSSWMKSSSVFLTPLLLLPASGLSDHSHPL